MNTITIRQTLQVDGPTRLLVVFDSDVPQTTWAEVAELLCRRFPDVEITALSGATIVDLGPEPRSPQVGTV